ncbi:vitellogenin-2-like [Macrobrachium nipponense]|uniref:vitellogenin-2-like n=1 Tax=Macrobrachium nipponense TaxID=159736 RepID=UPI0030C7BC7F
MSAYDDMCVLPNPTLVTQVCSTNISTSTHKNKAFLWRLIDCARLGLLLLLVASPVSAVPVRSRRTSTSSAYSYSSSDTRVPLEDTAEATLERAIAQQLQLAAERSSPKQLRSLQERELSPASRSRRGSGSGSSSSSSSSTSSSSGGSSSSSSIPSSSSSRHYSSSSSSVVSSRRMEDQPDDVGNNARTRREAHWSQPCTNLTHDTNNTQQSLSEYILRAVAKAYSYMDSFKEKFAQETLNMDWRSAIDTYAKDQNIDFLKQVTIPTTLDFNAQLQEAYEMMQRLAVGIEQVTLDQALYRGTFLEEFRRIENQIVAILCQLHYAMVHQQLSPSVVVTKEIMAETYRDLESEGARKMRDTIIVREYDNALTHLKNIFTEFEKVA